MLRERLESEHILLLRQHHRYRDRLKRMARSGELVAVLPGAYALPASASDPRVRALALCRALPNAVLTGAWAARLGYDLHRNIPAIVEAATRARPRPGYRFSNRDIPPHQQRRVGDLRFTAPAWTALDLALIEGPGAIDNAMRLGVALAELHAALRDQGSRRGATQLHSWLAGSAQRPWSFAERCAHVALLKAGFDDWVGNYPLRLPGRNVVLDIAFPAYGVAVEIDGYEHHSSHRAFVEDRLRDADLVAAGWLVVRVPAAVILDDPARFVAIVRATLRARSPSA